MAIDLTDNKFVAWLGRQPLRRRRSVMWLLWHARHVLRGFPSYGHERAFAGLLGLGRSAARRLDRRTEFNDVLGMLEWATLNYRNVAELVEDSNHSVIHNEQCIARLAADGGSLILAPLHMGAYVLAMANLINRYFKNRRVLILRFHDQNKTDEVVLRRVSEIGCEVRFMNVQRKETFIEALRFARQSCVIVCFVDLPESYGSARSVELFGKPARLALGIEQLARALKAPIVPMSVNSYVDKDVINIGQAFEAGHGASDSRDDVSRRISGHVHASVVNAPDHWHMWSRIDEFMTYDEPAGERALM